MGLIVYYNPLSMPKEVMSSYTVPCEGVAKYTVAPLVDRPANPTITVYVNGVREVGCPYLGKKAICRAALVAKDRSRCIQLFPVRIPDFRLEQRGSRGGSPVSFDHLAIEKKLRELNLSQTAVANAINRSQSFVSTVIIHGSRRSVGSGSSVDAAYRLSSVLGMTLEEMLTNIEDIERVKRYKKIIETQDG